MNYYRFLFKKTMKNRATSVPLLLLLAAIIGLYVINQTSGEFFSYKGGLTDHHEETKDLEEYYEGLQNDGVAYSAVEVASFEAGHQDVREQSMWSAKALQLAEEEKWDEALGYSINLLNQQLEANEQAEGSLFPAEHMLVLKGELEMYEQLQALEQEPDTEGYETFGFTYVFRVMDSLFPVLIVLILAVLLTEVFLNSYKKGMNIEVLLPMSFSRLTAKRIWFSSLLAGTVYLFALAISFVMASLVKGTGNVLYPVLLYSVELPETSPIWIVLVKMGTLQLLGILSLVLLISLISFFVQNNLVSLLITLVAVIGSPMVFRSIEAFHAIAHLNPFTYLASGNVVTRFIHQDIPNTHATFETGIVSLGVFSFLLAVLINILAYRHEQKSMYAAKE
ncbi:hypothetical protein [Planococcus shixiaomingii]|uniref:hypothetical protein n=1 Tax=Planococcus shixiaomingii TaxID=3058393 RepID=UPI002639C94C|nr:hypothetical protein [Planococcus sp. N022]WKA56569.1 hypothetical protein QWY21_09545 [Planococcus sp. N022]